MIRKFILFVFLCGIQLIYASGYKSFSQEVSPVGAALGNSGFMLFGENAVQYWNPASVSTVAHRKISLYGASFFQDNQQFYLDVILPRKNQSTIGFFAFMNTISDIELRELPSPEPTGVTSSDDVALGITYAKKINKQFHAGISLRYIYTSLLGFTAHGIAGDFSFIRYFQNNVTLSGGVRNIGISSRWIEQSMDLPEEILLGLRKKDLFLNNDHQLSLQLLFRYIAKDPENSFISSISASYMLKKHLQFNMGYSAGNDAYKLSAGLGLYYMRLAFSYAIHLGESGLNNAHFMGLNLLF